jgi:hypothetical protein
MLKVNSIIIIFLLAFSLNNYAQTYELTNKNESIRILFFKDSLQVEIKNESDKSIFLPVIYPLTQYCSESGNMHFLDFGIDLQVFIERGRFELEEILPKTSKTISAKLIACGFDSIINFTFQFYMRKMPKQKNTTTIFNTDFLVDKNWLKKGDWEWGELLVDRRMKIK